MVGPVPWSMSTVGILSTGRFGGFVVSEPTTVAADKEAPAKRKRGGGPSLILAMLPLLILFAGATILFWMTKTNGAEVYRYWEYFIPVLAVLSLISGWGQSYLSGELRIWYLIKQVVHWGGLVAVLYLLNTQGFRGLMDDGQYSTLVLYLLAFTTLLAAIHMDLKLLFFAGFLVFCGYLMAVPGDNAALAFIGDSFGIADAQAKSMEITIGVAVVGFIASLFILVMMRGALMTKRIGAKRNKTD
jgi:flagellar basal body-associated protein FliL